MASLSKESHQRLGHAGCHNNQPFEQWARYRVACCGPREMNARVGPSLPSDGSGQDTTAWDWPHPVCQRTDHRCGAGFWTQILLHRTRTIVNTGIMSNDGMGRCMVMALHQSKVGAAVHLTDKPEPEPPVAAAPETPPSLSPIPTFSHPDPPRPLLSPPSRSHVFLQLFLLFFFSSFSCDKVAL